MHFLKDFVMVATCIALCNSGTVPPTTEPVNEGEVIDLFKNHHKRECSDSSQCSCSGGIPICYEGNCNCIYPHLVCFEHKHCGDLCNNGVGICLANACKCYDLVENSRLTESISPWS